MRSSADPIVTPCKSLRDFAAPSLLVCGLAATALTVSAYRDGPPEGHTGGFGEPTCEACHMGSALNEASGSIALQGVPSAFKPGQPYALRVVLRRPGMPVGGFELAARFAEGSSNAGTQAGSFEVLDDKAGVFNAPNNVSYVHHTRAGSDAAGDSIVWQLRWIAPSHGAPVVFHLVGNAGNDDESPLGDYIYTFARVVSAAK